MADVSQITLPNGTVLDIKDATARASIPTKVSSIKMNGTSYNPTDGVVNLGTVITSHQDISGKVSGPSSAVADRVAVFNGTTGKIIKDSGFTIAKSVPSNAVFTDTTVTSSFTRPSYQAGVTDVTLQPLVNDLRANHFAFLPADQIIIEKTTDGGVTWTDAGISDSTKVALFSETRPGINLPLINGEKNILCGIRVTFTAMKYNVPSGTAETNKYNYWNSTYVSSTERYSNIRDLYFWVSSSADKMNIKVQCATGGNSTSWITAFDNNTALFSGWSGNDYIKLDSTRTFGGGTTQTGNVWNYRITFMSAYNSGQTSFSDAYKTQAQSIMEIRGYGTTWWTRGNMYASSDHMYSWDINKNVTFPANVTATNFVGKINNHTVSADVPSNAVFTDTTYSSLAAASGGTSVSLVTTGEKYTWNNKYSKPSNGIPATDLAEGVLTSIIDDTAGNGTQHKTWSADKIYDSLATKYVKPQNGIPASDLETGSIPVTDVKVNNTSVVSNYIANIPIAGASTLGVVKVASSTYGLSLSSGEVRVSKADASTIKTGSDGYKPITAELQHNAVFYGLAKAAGDTTQASSSNAVGTYTTNAKTSIRTMIGAGTYSKPDTGIPATDLAEGSFLSLIANDHSTTKSYSAGEYCIYNKKLYRAKNSISAGSWNSNSWEEVKIMDEIFARCLILPAAGVSF